MRPILVAAVVIGIPLAAIGQPAEPAGSASAEPAGSASAEPAGSAHAVEADAERLATEGKFPAAAARYREAYAIDPRPDLLCNVGVAYHKAQDWPRAQLYLGQCLTRAGSLDADFVTAVRNVLGSVDDKLRTGEFAPVRITVKPDNAVITIGTFGPGEKLIGTQLIWLAWGTHEIEVSAEGYVARSETVEVAGVAEIARTIGLDHVSDSVETPPVATVGMGARRSKTPAVISTIATGVAAGVAVVLWVQARSLADKADDIEDLAIYRDRVDGARQRQHLAWAVGGVAVVGAGLSAFLWYRATRSSTRIEVAPTGAGTGGASVWISGRF